MGIQLSVSTIKMMKSIFFACLVAAVYAEAEPKADADAYYGPGYSGIVPGYTGYALPGYTGYAGYGAYATPAYNTYRGYGYAGLRGHYIGKREAEAEPEADADAYYGYNYNLGYNNLGYGYAAPIARTYAAAPVATVARTYAAPITTVARSYAVAPIARSYGTYGYGLSGLRAW